MTTPPAPVYLIDGSAYIYRAYHAISPLSNRSGLPTHAIYGFTNILLRVIREKAPRFLAVAFDAKGPNFRHGLYPAYKAHRPAMPEDLAAQIPYIKEITAAYNILCLERQGFEADDLLAAAAHLLHKTGTPVVLVSGDKDLLQLVCHGISWWDPMKDVLMDAEAVIQKYQVPPEGLTDLFALIGDASDNVPGVPGVGPKTAGKLLQEFGSLDRLYDQLDRITKPKLKENLAAHREQAFLSRQLIRLAHDVEVPAEPAEYQLPSPDTEKLRELFNLLDFSRLVKSELPAQPLAREGFCLVNTREALEELRPRLEGAAILTLDTETTSLDPLTAELVGLALCTDAGHAFYIPLGHKEESGTLCTGQLPPRQVLNFLRPFLADPALPKLAHHLKFDQAVLENYDLELAGPLWDTMIASYLLDPSRRSHKLDDLCEEFLQRRLTSFAEITKNDKREDCFAYVPPAEAQSYSCEDVRATLLLWDEFRPQLEKLQLWDLYTNIEMALVPILLRMERAGIIVDQEALLALSREFGEQLEELEREIYRLAGGSFNINSPRQLGEILFERLKLPQGRKTKTGYSTDFKVLEKLSLYHDLPAAVIAHRNLAKLKSTYVDKLATQIDPRSGRVHTSFNQTITATGRLSSSEPNLQNIPIRTPEGQRLRSAFVPAAGHLFLAADYSQIDLRVLAHYSQDPALLAAFRQGQDVHGQTAAEIFRVHPGLITSEMRRVAKTINFGIVYGMSAFGLASQLNISRREAQVFIDRYFKLYAGVKHYMSEIVKQARRDGFVTTLLHRRRLLPDIGSPNKVRREFAERTAINTPIQGTAADLIKLAMIRVEQRLPEEKMHAKLLLQIHDELVFEIIEAQADSAAALIRHAMENVLPLTVPLVVNVTTGRTLAET